MAQPMQLETLRKKWRQREEPLQQLYTLLSQESVPDVLVYGPTGTGKTSIVRDILEALPHAYIKLARLAKLRGVLAAIVSALAGHKRKRDSAYSCGVRGSENALCCELASLCPPGQRSRIVVLDDAQLLLRSAGQVDGVQLLRAVLRLRDQTGANLAVVLICSSDGSTEVLHQLPAMQAVAFPQYGEGQMLSLLMQDTPAGEEPELYRRFLTSVVLAQGLCLARTLPDLRTLSSALWPRYILPARQRQLSRPLGDEHTRWLYGRVEEHVRSALHSFEPGLCNALLSAAPAAAGGGVDSYTGMCVTFGSSCAATPHGALGLELPLSACYVLVAAFVASRNKPSTDKLLFEDSRGTKGKRRGGQRGNPMDADRQAEAARTAMLRGPHAFTLARLQLIYRMLRRGADARKDACERSRAVAALMGGPGCLAGDGGAHGTGRRALRSLEAWGGILTSGRCRQQAAAPKLLQQQQQAQAAQRGGPRQPAQNTQPRAQHEGQCDLGHLGYAGGMLDVDSADLMSTVSSLVAARLMSQTSDDVLDDPRFHCDAPEELVTKIGADLGIVLKGLLKYG